MVCRQMTLVDRFVMGDPVPEQAHRVDLVIERASRAGEARKRAVQARPPESHLVVAALAKERHPEAEAQLRHHPVRFRRLAMADQLLPSLLDHAGTGRVEVDVRGVPPVWPAEQYRELSMYGIAHHDLKAVQGAQERA